jgi:archaellin
MKKKICFGAGVIFKHIDSNSYVSGTIKPSTGSNGAFTVQVSEKLSDSLVFKLLPYRSF